MVRNGSAVVARFEMASGLHWPSHLGARLETVVEIAGRGPDSRPTDLLADGGLAGLMPLNPSSGDPLHAFLPEAVPGRRGLRDLSLGEGQGGDMPVATIPDGIGGDRIVWIQRTQDRQGSLGQLLDDEGRPVTRYQIPPVHLAERSAADPAVVEVAASVTAPRAMPGAFDGIDAKNDLPETADPTGGGSERVATEPPAAAEADTPHLDARDAAGGTTAPTPGGETREQPQGEGDRGDSADPVQETGPDAVPASRPQETEGDPDRMDQSPIRVILPDAAESASSAEPVTAATFQGISFDMARRGLADQGEAQQALDGIVEINANAVAVVGRYRVADRNASKIFQDDVYTELLSNIELAIRSAHARGLDVMLKPHLNSDDHSWSGLLAPSDPEAFFASYEKHLLVLAELAEETGVRLFSLGNELGNLFGPAWTGHWEGIIEAVREVYSGELTIAAQYWQLDQIEFWDSLDYIGINGYIPMSDSAVPSVEEIRDAWTSADAPYGQTLGMSVIDYTRQLAERWDRPAIFTEIGFRAIEGGASNPGQWDRAGAVSEEAQANMLQGFLEAWAGQGDWFRGTFLWGWNLTQGYDNDYSPQGRLGEQVVSDAFGARDGITAPDEGAETEIRIRVTGDGPEGFTPELLVNLDGLNVAEVAVGANRRAGEYDEFVFRVNDADPQRLTLFYDNPVHRSGLFVDWIEIEGVRHEGEHAAANGAIPTSYADSPTFASMFTNGGLIFDL